MTLERKLHKKLPKSISRSYVIIGIILSLWVAIVWYTMNSYNNVREVIGTWGIAHNLWQFFNNDGNTGIIEFWSDPTDSGNSWAHLYIPPTGKQVLSWSFWIDTVWWASFRDVEFSLTDTGAWIWSLSWYAWSEYAGWMDFWDVTYQLSNTSFSGYAWNDWIWWINMQWASLNMTSSGAIGKVKILWNLWGNKIYNTSYTLNGNIATATVTSMLNEVRKNVSLITRNLPADKINSYVLSQVFDYWDNGGFTKTIDGKMILHNTSASTVRAEYVKNIESRFENLSGLDPVYSAIIIGADVYIDDSVIPQSDWKPRAIIALKNDAWYGGNIIIKWWVTRILSSLIAEWSIYSGEYNAWIQKIYNDNPADLFKIPNRQLYLYGTTISNNTIWWYGTDNGTDNYCPFNVSPCDSRAALMHDFNHLRDFQKNLPEWQLAVLRWYKDNTYDDYSVIIEYDSRILSNPPPGLETIQ